MSFKPRYQFSILETSDLSENTTLRDDRTAFFSSTKMTASAMNNSSTGTYQTSSRQNSSVCTFPRTPSLCVGSSTSKRTPYSTSVSTRLSEQPTAIVALVEGRGFAKGEVGLASMNLKSSVVNLSQFSDNPTYVKVSTKLLMFRPAEVILPDTACEQGSMNALYERIANDNPNTEIVRVQRKYFNESKGLQYIKQLSVPAAYASLEKEIRTKYYCLAAAAALLKYIEHIQNLVYAPASLKFVFKGSEKTAMIDFSTAVNLELLENMQDPKSGDSLFGIMNATKTPMGSRLLRANILQPPCDESTIKLRQDAVQDLISHPDLFYSMQAVISRFLDIDHLLSLCVQVPKQETMKTAEAMITNVIYLKHTLEIIEPLRNALQGTENQLLKTYYESLQDNSFEIMLEKINDVINEDTRYQKSAFNMRTQKCFAVRPGINGLLDVSRKIFTELVDAVSEMENFLTQQYGLPIRSSYNTTRGFFLQLFHEDKKNPISQDQLPACFIKVSKSRSFLNFTTVDMEKLNERIKLALHDVYQMTASVLKGLLANVRVHMSSLHQLADCVAMLDMVTAFAHSCTVSEYVRPVFTDTLAVKQGRHPILNKICSEPPIANNIFASSDSNFVVITGPNMGGKSTYLRQILLLQIMAQVGSFVPAEYASFRIADQMFSRIGSDDDIETNSSTFMVEMRETSYIIQALSDHSLVIADELGRGTSLEEGVGLCFSICEHLLNTKAFTFFATHFLEVTNLDRLYPNVVNYCFQAVPADGNVHPHQISKGTITSTRYGMQLIAKSSLVQSVIEDTENIGKMLAEQQCETVVSECDDQWVTYRLAALVVKAVTTSHDDEDTVKQELKALQLSAQTAMPEQ